MLIKKCLTDLAVIVEVCVGLFAFNAHSGRDFGHRFFTVSGLVVSALSVGLVVATNAYSARRQSSPGLSEPLFATT